MTNKVNGLKRGIVYLSEYSDTWPILFDEEKKELENKLGSLALSIEHVGSTSIRNIKAKPIIDIAVSVEDESKYRDVIACLDGQGYELREAMRDKNRLFFAKGPENNRTHYIHVHIHNSEDWLDQLFFRDYMNDHLEDALEYENLKVALSLKYPKDRNKYTEENEEFILGILSDRV